MVSDGSRLQEALEEGGARKGADGRKEVTSWSGGPVVKTNDRVSKPFRSTASFGMSIPTPSSTGVVIVTEAGAVAGDFNETTS